jgi:uncharacterized membrane protein YhaH (DUF805 family)
LVKKLLGYLSFKGRANRQRYWVTAFLLTALFIIGMMLTLGMSDIAPALGVAFIPVFVLFGLAVLANGARRLHDRNKSAWWLILFVGVPSFFSLVAELGALGGGPAEAANFIGALGLPFSIWGFVELGCLKGSKGPNKYGDDPLEPVAEVFA